MLSKRFILILFLLNALNSFSQDKPDKGFDPSNLFIGGSVSFNLGGYDNTFLAGLNPHFGYTFASWIDAAVVANFQYLSERDIYDNRYHNTTYGTGFFTRIYPVDFIYIQAQPEYNFTDVKFISDGGIVDKIKLRSPSLLLGAGFVSSRSSKNSFTYLSILFDVLKNANSPYVDGYNRIIPIIRGGINIGLNANGRRKNKVKTSTDQASLLQ